MKTIILSILCMLPLWVLGQTTQEEYTYITKGYKRQITEGLDPAKKNYTFELIEKLDSEQEESNTSFTFTRMVHKKDGLKAIILSFYQDGTLETFCLPHPKTKESIYLPAIQQFNSFWVDKEQFPYLTSVFMKMMYLYELDKEVVETEMEEVSKQ